MKKIMLIAFIAMVFAALPYAQAISDPNITFIPTFPSANSSLIMVVDAGEFASARVSWLVPEAGPEAGMGSVPQLGDKFVCYFSCADSGLVPCAPDPENTCGPTPFKVAANYPEILINVVDQFGITKNSSVEKDFGDLILDYTITEPDANGTIVMRVTTYKPQLPDRITYQALYRDNLTIAKYNGQNVQGDLEIMPGFALYTGNATLGPGEYFLVLGATSIYGPGGAVTTVDVPDTGPTCSDGVQNGDEEGIDCGGSVCEPCGTGPVDYVEKIIAGIPDPVPELSIRSGHSFSYNNANFTIKNIGNNTLYNLSLDINQNISSRVSLQLANTTIQPGQILFYTMRLTNVQESMDINSIANIMAGSVKVGELPIRFRVSLFGDGDGPTVIVQEGDLSMAPKSWEEDVISGEVVTKTLTLTNNGDDSVTNLTFSTEIAGLSAALPESIAPSESETATLSFSREVSSTYCCQFSITSSGGSQSGVAVLSVYPNVTSNILALSNMLASLKSEFSTFLTPDQITLVDDMLESNIESDINRARTEFQSGNLKLAETKLIEASAKLTAIDSVKDLLSGASTDIDCSRCPGGTGSGEFDYTTIIIVVVIIVVLVAVFYFFKMKRPKIGGRKRDESLDEEFEYNEGVPEES